MKEVEAEPREEVEAEPREEVEAEPREEVEEEPREDVEAEPRGEVALVLHTHLPWVGGHGVWPVGEEWLFQAWGHSWLAVTRVLLRLAAEGHRDVLTLGVTPMVAAQVADPRLAQDMGTWLGGQMWRAEEQRWHWWLPESLQSLSHHHWRHHQDLLELHEQVQAQGGLLSVWADLQRRGVIELLGGPATHPYLPLVDDPELIDAQLEAGLASHESWAGERPTGIWVPELGYRPRSAVADPTAEPRALDEHGSPDLPRPGVERPGLEEHYARAGITHVLVDAPTMIRAAGGADRDWSVRPTVPDVADNSADEIVHDGVQIGSSDVVAFTRDLAVAYRVWSPTEGYPGDPWYRDFHTQGTFGAHQSHRVTGRDVPWQQKQPYDPDAAIERTHAHVAELHGLLRTTLDPRPGALTVAAYDTELLGHWWYEGPTWLEGLLRAIEADPKLRTTTLRSRLSRRPVTARLDLPESSWGLGKRHASWVTPATRPMWQRLADVEARARSAVAKAGAGGDGPLDDATAKIIDQLARELAQLRCSDWPFMVTRGNSAGYAQDRVHHHGNAADALCWMLESATRDEQQLDTIQSRDPQPAAVSSLAATLRWSAR
jgi:1,4-alpha-glucan branching enzyme